MATLACPSCAPQTTYWACGTVYAIGRLRRPRGVDKTTNLTRSATHGARWGLASAAQTHLVSRATFVARAAIERIVFWIHQRIVATGELCAGLTTSAPAAIGLNSTTFNWRCIDVCVKLGTRSAREQERRHDRISMACFHRCPASAMATSSSRSALICTSCSCAVARTALSRP